MVWSLPPAGIWLTRETRPFRPRAALIWLTTLHMLWRWPRSLRRLNYRSENRMIVFQVLGETVGMASARFRVLSKCHDVRNMAEYEGHTEIDSKLLAELIAIANELEALIMAFK